MAELRDLLIPSDEENKTLFGLSEGPGISFGGQLAPSTAQPLGTALSDVAAGMYAEDVAAAAVVVLSESDKSPEEHIKIRDTARALGVPDSIVGLDPGTFEGRLLQREMMDTVQSRPRLLEYFKNKDSAKLAREDLQGLARINDAFDQYRNLEGTGGVFGLAKSIYGSLHKGWLGGLSSAFGEWLGERWPYEIEPGRENEVQNLATKERITLHEAARRLGMKKPAGFIPESITAFGKEQAQWGHRLYELERPDLEPFSPAYWAYGTATGITHMLPAIVASMALKNPKAGLSIMSSQAFGHRYLQARERGESPGAARIEAGLFATLEWVSEIVPLGLLTTPASSHTRRALKAMGAEAIQEMFVELADIGFDVVALGKELGRDVTATDIVTRLIDAGIIGAGTGGGLTVITAPFVGTIKKQVDAAKNKIASDVQKVWDIVDQVQETKVANLDPTEAAVAVDKLAEDSGLEEVFFDPVGLEEYFQKAGLDREEMFELLDITEKDIEDATNTGGSVSVSLAKLATTPELTEHREGLAPFMKLAYDGLSQSDIELIEKLEGDKPAWLGGVISSQTLEAQPDDTSQAVYDLAFQQLVDTGSTPQDARIQAIIVKSLWRTLATKVEGEDALSLYNKAFEKVRRISFEEYKEERARRARGDVDVRDVDVIREEEKGRPLVKISDREYTYRGYRFVVDEDPGDLGGQWLIEPEEYAGVDIPTKMTPTMKGLGLPSTQVAMRAVDEFIDIMSPAVRAGEKVLGIIPTEGPIGEDLTQTAASFGVTREQLAEQLAEAGGDITNTAAFRAWFGDSKVVDENGVPLVVHHGTYRAVWPGVVAFDAFEKTEDIGFHFGSREQAEVLIDAEEPEVPSAGEGPAFLSAYLSIKNPLRLEDHGTWGPLAIYEALVGAQIIAADEVMPDFIRRFVEKGRGTTGIIEARTASYAWLRDRIQAAGYDGVVYLNRGELSLDMVMEKTGLEVEEAEEERDVVSTDEDFRDIGATDSWIAFNPEQIKSTENVGTFDPADPRFFYQDIFDFLAPEGQYDGLRGHGMTIWLDQKPDRATLVIESGGQRIEVRGHPRVGAYYEGGRLDRIINSIPKMVNISALFAGEKRHLSSDMAVSVLDALEFEDEMQRKLSRAESSFYQSEEQSRQTMRIRQLAFENDVRSGNIDPLDPLIDMDEVNALRADMKLPPLPVSELFQASRVAAPEVVLPHEVVLTKADKARIKKLKKEVPGLASVLPHLMPDEQALLTPVVAKNMVAIFKQLPSPAEMASVAYSGRAKRGWYINSVRALIEIFGEDAPRFTALLAALSPRTSVESNAINALRVWAAWLAEGRPTDRGAILRIMGANVQGEKGEDSILGAWINNTVTALTAADPTRVILSGPKANSFMINLTGLLDAVTNDAWVAVYMDIDANALSIRSASPLPGKGAAYLAVSAITRRAAQIISHRTGETWAPAEVQETVWSWAKALYEKSVARGEPRSALEVLQQDDLSHEDIDGVPDFERLFLEGNYRSVLEQSGYSDRLSVVERTVAARVAAEPLAGSAYSVTGKDQQHLRRAAKRLDRVAKARAAEKVKTEILVNMSAATTSDKAAEKLPGLVNLVKAATAGDDTATILLQEIAGDALRALTYGIASVEVTTTAAVGLYGKLVEPSLGVSLSFQERDRVKVLSAVARFADNFMQEQIHVRTAKKARTTVGHEYGDGSFNTPVVRFMLTEPLTRARVREVIDASGLAGFTVTDEYLETYLIGAPKDGKAFEEFNEQVEKARASLGSDARSHARETDRIWAYGSGYGATNGYNEIRGDVRTARDDQAVVTTRRVASRIAGFPVRGVTPAKTITEEQAQKQRRIADAYDKMQIDGLDDPLVVYAYERLAAELIRQYDALPIKVEVFTGKGFQPYVKGTGAKAEVSSRDMRLDVLLNNHLYIAGTRAETFGPEGTPLTNHPLLTKSGRVDINGYPLLVNDLLRAVHDYYAHTATTAMFGPLGEEAAWRTHMEMTNDPWARWALTTETRGQNSWINFRKGVKSKTLRDRGFADQKANLLPLEFVMTGNPFVDAPLRLLPGSEALELGSPQSLDEHEYLMQQAPPPRPLPPAPSLGLPGLFLAARKAVEANPQEKATGDQWLKHMQKAPYSISDEEIEWIVGFRQFLASTNKSISKRDVLAFVDQHGIRLNEIVLGQKEKAPKIWEVFNPYDGEIVKTFETEIAAAEYVNLYNELKTVEDFQTRRLDYDVQKGTRYRLVWNLNRDPTSRIHADDEQQEFIGHGFISREAAIDARIRAIAHGPRYEYILTMGGQVIEADEQLLDYLYEKEVLKDYDPMVGLESLQTTDSPEPFGWQKVSWYRKDGVVPPIPAGRSLETDDFISPPGNFSLTEGGRLPGSVPVWMLSASDRGALAQFYQEITDSYDVITANPKEDLPEPKWTEHVLDGGRNPREFYITLPNELHAVGTVPEGTTVIFDMTGSTTADWDVLGTVGWTVVLPDGSEYPNKVLADDNGTVRRMNTQQDLSDELQEELIDLHLERVSVDHGGGKPVTAGFDYTALSYRPVFLEAQNASVREWPSVGLKDRYVVTTFRKKGDTPYTIGPAVDNGPPFLSREAAENFIERYRAAVDAWKEEATEHLLEAIKTFKVPDSLANATIKDWISPHGIGVPEADLRLVVRIRIDERTNRAGERMLFIQEIQPERQTAGRISGYEGEFEQHKERVRNAYVEWLHIEQGGRRASAERIAAATFNESGESHWSEFKNKVGFENLNENRVVPQIPFKNKWRELALKRMIQVAAEEGFAHVAWTTGQMQTDRYDQTVVLESLHVVAEFRAGQFLYTFSGRGKTDNAGDYQQERVPEKNLANHLGKDMAKQVIDHFKQQVAAEEGSDIQEEISTGGAVYIGDTIFPDLELSVGGNKLRTLYDSLIPRDARKIGKPYGAEVTVQQFGGLTSTFSTEDIERAQNAVNNDLDLAGEIFETAEDAEHRADVNLALSNDDFVVVSSPRFNGFRLMKTSDVPPVLYTLSDERFETEEQAEAHLNTEVGPEDLPFAPDTYQTVFGHPPPAVEETLQIRHLLKPGDYTIEPATILPGDPPTLFEINLTDDYYVRRAADRLSLRGEFYRSGNYVKRMVSVDADEGTPITFVTENAARQHMNEMMVPAEFIGVDDMSLSALLQAEEYVIHESEEPGPLGHFSIKLTATYHKHRHQAYDALSAIREAGIEVGQETLNPIIRLLGRKLVDFVAVPEEPPIPLTDTQRRRMEELQQLERIRDGKRRGVPEKFETITGGWAMTEEEYEAHAGDTFPEGRDRALLNIYSETEQWERLMSDYLPDALEDVSIDIPMEVQALVAPWNPQLFGSANAAYAAGRAVGLDIDDVHIEENEDAALRELQANEPVDKYFMTLTESYLHKLEVDELKRREPISRYWFESRPLSINRAQAEKLLGHGYSIAALPGGILVAGEAPRIPPAGTYNQVYSIIKSPFALMMEERPVEEHYLPEGWTVVEVSKESVPWAGLDPDAQVAMMIQNPELEEGSGRWMILDETGKSATARAPAGLPSTNPVQAVDVETREQAMVELLSRVPVTEIIDLDEYDQESFTLSPDMVREMISFQLADVYESIFTMRQYREMELLNQRDIEWRSWDNQEQQQAAAAYVKGSNEEVLALPITSALKDTVLGEGLSLFQPPPPDDPGGLDLPPPRGVFSLSGDRSRRIITLFEESKDEVTFLHEMAHAYLELLRDLHGQPGTDALTDDMDAILRHVGASSFEELGRVQHEKFAETWEKYLYTGEAPTDELRSAMSRIKKWMIDIYIEVRNIGATGVTLTPEIKGVMDRMLATEDQLAQTEAGGNYEVQLTGKEMGLTETETEKLDALRASAKERARERMLKQLMKDITKAKTASYKEEVEKEKDVVENEMKDMPVWKAISYLRLGEVIGVEAEDQPKEVLKLDRGQVEELLGVDTAKQLPGGLTQHGITQKDGGLDLEVAAAMFGFASAQDMLTSILESAVIAGDKRTYLSIDEVIAREAKGRVRERNGDDLNPERIRAEATAAVNNEDQGELLILELNILRRLGAEDITAKGAEAREEAVTGLAQTVAEAEDTVATLAAKRLQKSAVTQRKAEAVARRQGDTATHVSQAVVRELARRRVADMTVDELNRLAKFSQDALRASKKTEEALLNRDFAAAQLHKWQQVWNHFLAIEATKARIKRDTVLKRLKKYAKIANFRKSSIADEYLERIQRLLDAYNLGPGRVSPEVARQQLDDLEAWIEIRNRDNGDQIVAPESVFTAHDISATKFSDLLDLDAAVKSLAKNGRDNSKEAKRKLKEFVQSLASEMEANAPKLKNREEYENLGQRVEDLADFVFGGHRKISHLLRELDGFVDMGPLWQAIFRPIADASSKELTMRADAHAALTKVWKLQEDRLGPRDRRRKYVVGGRKVTRDQILALALNWGNEGNRDAILNGARPWTEEDVLKAFDNLDDTDWNFVEQTWALIDSYWLEIKALEERMTGVAPPKVEPTPFILKSGREIKGSYYPISFDPKRSDRASRDAETAAKAGELMAGTWGRAATTHGHTIARTESRNKAVKLSADVMFRHIDQVIHDLAFREAVIDVHKIISSDIFRGTLRDVKGVHAPKYMDAWLRHVAGGDMVDMSPIDPFLRHARIGMSIAEMGFSIRTMLVQPMGITQSVARLGVGRVVAGIARFYANPFDNMKDITAKSVVMKRRGDNFDRELADASRKLKPDNVLDNIRSYSFFFIGKLDMSVAFPTWMAAYRQAVEEKKFNNTDAVAYADSVVEDTQGTGSAKDLAAVQRGGEGMRLFTSFYTFFAAYHQMVTDAIKITGQKKQEAGIAAATGYGASQFFWLVAMPALVTAWALDGGPEDEEEWWLWAGKEIGKYSLGGLVGIREIANAAFGDYGFSGPASMKVWKELSNTITQMQQGEIDKALLRSTIMLTGYLGHLPARQTWRLVEAYIDAQKGAGGPETAATVFGLRHYRD